jgi:prepilin-type N-terminal cleavage/methylation domain-containing protein
MNFLKRNKHKKQSGFTIIELSVGLVILSIITASYLNFKAGESVKAEFETLGNRISEHSTAIAEWTVDQAGAAVPATYTGTDFLKSNSDCGITTGGSEAYVPCDFDFSKFKHGIDPVTVISNSGGVTVAVTSWDAIEIGGVPQALGVGYAVRQAEHNGKDSLKGIIVYTENNAGEITASVNVNNGTGIYVKRSGDSMTGDLDLLTNNIDNINVLTATDIQAGDITTIGDNTAARMLAQTYIDSADNSYYVQPSQTSVLNDLDASSIRLTGNFVDGDACTTKTVGTQFDGKFLTCVDGIWKYAGGMPIGSILLWGALTIPDTFIEMNGQSTALYPELRAIVGNNVKDLRGVFVRGHDNGRGLDPGRVFGSYQEDADQRFTAYFNTDRSLAAYGGAAYVTGHGEGGWNGSNGNSLNLNIDNSRQVRTANEGRPKNVNLVYIIKAED